MYTTTTVKTNYLLAPALPVADAVPPALAGADVAGVLATADVLLLGAAALDVAELLLPLQATKPNDNTAAAKTTMVFLAMS